MKTLQDIKDEYAYEAGFADWRVLVSYGEDMDNHVDNVSKRFAFEVAKESLKNASENATMKIDYHDDSYSDSSEGGLHYVSAHDVECGGETGYVEIEKESILSESNIPSL